MDEKLFVRLLDGDWKSNCGPDGWWLSTRPEGGISIDKTLRSTMGTSLVLIHGVEAQRSFVRFRGVGICRSFVESVLNVLVQFTDFNIDCVGVNDIFE
jgi:hypothetical protein